eukprot:11041979-Alexandrium_andersonii.AAC.1
MLFLHAVLRSSEWSLCARCVRWVVSAGAWRGNPLHGARTPCSNRHATEQAARNKSGSKSSDSRSRSSNKSRERAGSSGCKGESGCLTASLTI